MLLAIRKQHRDYKARLCPWRRGWTEASMFHVPISFYYTLFFLPLRRQHNTTYFFVAIVFGYPFFSDISVSDKELVSCETNFFLFAAVVGIFFSNRNYLPFFPCDKDSSLTCFPFGSCEGPEWDYEEMASSTNRCVTLNFIVV